MRNWTIKEAVAVINEGKDTEAIKEIAKHFPMFFMLVAKNDLAGLAAVMSDKFTVRKIEMAFASTDDGDDEDAGDASTDADTESGNDDGDDEDLNSLSTKELIKLCVKRGIKVPKYGKNKQFYLDALNGASDDVDDTEDDSDDDEQEDDPYAGKNAMQLFKMCKERGIKAQPKRKAVEYIKLLKAADAKAAEEDSSDDDDWSDEEPAPKAPKKDKKATKNVSSKNTKKKAEEESDSEPDDDDDEWEI